MLKNTGGLLHLNYNFVKNLKKELFFLHVNIFQIQNLFFLNNFFLNIKNNIFDLKFFYYNILNIIFMSFVSFVFFKHFLKYDDDSGKSAGI